MTYTYTRPNGISIPVSKERYEELLWQDAGAAQVMINEFTPKLDQVISLARRYTIFGVSLLVLALVVIVIHPLLSVVSLIVGIWCLAKGKRDRKTVRMAQNDLEVQKGAINRLEDYLHINHPEVDVVDYMRYYGIKKVSNYNM